MLVYIYNIFLKTMTIMLYNVFFFLRYESFLILRNNWQYTKIYTRQYTKIPLGKIFQNHSKVQPK